MKMYNNGQRQGMMYGGGATPRKPMMYGGMAKKKKMQMGGLADQNRKSSTGQAGMMNPMGGMTEKKKFSMGMAYGGNTSKKKSNGFGMLSVKAGIDNNPNPTAADRIAGATKKKKKMATQAYLSVQISYDL